MGNLRKQQGKWLVRDVESLGSNNNNNYYCFYCCYCYYNNNNNNNNKVFGDIMIDYSYVECTSACVKALVAFLHCYCCCDDDDDNNNKNNSNSDCCCYRQAEVMNAIQAGREFMKSIQRSDGSWYGSWGNWLLLLVVVLL